MSFGKKILKKRGEISLTEHFHVPKRPESDTWQWKNRQKWNERGGDELVAHLFLCCWHRQWEGPLGDWVPNSALASDSSGNSMDGIDAITRLPWYWDNLSFYTQFPRHDNETCQPQNQEKLREGCSHVWAIEAGHSENRTLAQKLDYRVQTRIRSRKKYAELWVPVFLILWYYHAGYYICQSFVYKGL